MEAPNLTRLLAERRAQCDAAELDGKIAEAYAQEKLEMESVPCTSSGFDGLINGRRVSLRAIEKGSAPSSMTHFSIRKGMLAGTDDLLVVVLDDDVAFHIGPVPIDQITYTQTPTERRFSLAKIQAAVG